MTNCLAVSANAIKGRLAMLWRDGIDLHLISYSSYHIDMIVADPSCFSKWRVTAKWLSRPDCATVLKTTLGGVVLLVPDKLLLAKEALRNWGEGCKKDRDEHISCLHMQLDARQHQIVLDSILSDMALIIVQFVEIERKEIYWAYRGRGLEDGYGTWDTDEELIASRVVHYFKALFSTLGAGLI
ncbi:hypothetical protein GOBAR_AA04386 [Gossypium barbadense]|uniref:Uncharacterized protein n=1 Tax=Gossypium barbadense TaxID=3634 RepID=A0A2P5YKU0_GOSBA|nr:hypothetical protein GOBAR_AA04386 [Gossypium barbadense]